MLKVGKDVELRCKDQDKKKGLCKDIYEDDRYFLRRLQRHDEAFSKMGQTDPHESYGRKCQQMVKQPVVLKYNPETKKSVKRDSFTESLKFGSNKERYYICPKYWCPFCEVPVLESDIDKRTIKIKKVDKKYNYIRAKCPYCSEKIYVREKDGVVYNYPRLLDDSKVPCCFRTPKK